MARAVRFGPSRIAPLMDVRTRGYRREDEPACLDLFDSNVPEYFSPTEREEFVAFLRALPGPYLVLEIPGEGIVGCGGHAVRADAPVADLCWGIVRRDRHRVGLGRALTLARIEAARVDPGIEAIALQTSQHTTGFYERMGFRTESVETDGFAPGLDRCRMRLDLPPLHSP